MNVSRPSLAVIALFAAICLSPLGVLAETLDYAWIEAEDVTRTNVPKPEAPFPSDLSAEEKAKLSGGAWVHPTGPAGKGPYWLAWDFQAPSTGQYDVWVRKFWKHGPFRWRIDKGPWQTCGRDIALHSGTYLRLHIGTNWVFLGQVRLARGKHTLQVEMLDPAGGGALDCFALTRGTFQPRGKLKPGEVSGKSEEGFFAWEPPADPLRDDCPIDLRSLNEPQAGAEGFVRRDGEGFVLGDGTPVRFWMVQGDGLMSMKKPMVDHHARRLAKYGVNLVRLGMLGMFNDWKAGNEESLSKRLDRLHYLIAALKREGIYVYLGHLYWHTHVQVSEDDGFPGHGGGKAPVARLFVDPRMQQWYKQWVRKLVTTPNPYTKLPIARDPGVAVVEIQNESSMFFWTFKPASFVPSTRELLQRSFGQWAAKRYGSASSALKKWGPEKAPKGDDPRRGLLGLYPVGLLTGAEWAPPQRNEQRAVDQLRWMFELQMGFYRDMVADWRNELGVKTMISCSNWVSADPKVLGTLERYTYTAGDVICRNSYYGVDYKPRPKRGYAVDVGDTFLGRSALTPPSLPQPLTVAHVNHHPYMITENNWTRPNRYRAEWPFLVATYARLMGVDGWTFFALDTPAWNTSMNVWELNTPTILGQFPAAARIYRQGLVAEAPTVVNDRLSLNDLLRMKGSNVYEMSGRDIHWESLIGDYARNSAEGMNVDPMAFFVGKVNREVTTDEPSRLTMTDLAANIDHREKIVTSATKELRWDYEDGVVTVDTPRAQGACGFLAERGRIELADVTLEVGNDYASVLVVSLDGKPIKASQRLLVQVATEDHPHGFKTRPVGDYQRITDLGGYPLNVRKIDATVTLHAKAGAKATVLDGNGDPTDRNARTSVRDGHLVITLPPEAIYTLVERP
jgi:hypothetical protein